MSQEQELGNPFSLQLPNPNTPYSLSNLQRNDNDNDNHSLGSIRSNVFDLNSIDPHTSQRMRLNYSASSAEETDIMNNIIQDSYQMDIKDDANTIDENQMGYHAIHNENIRIGDFLREEKENIVLRVKDSYYLTNRSEIVQAYNDCIFYKCFRAGNTSEFLTDSNIDLQAPLFDFKKLGIPLQYFYQINIDFILLFTSANHYVVKDYNPEAGDVQETVASTISIAVYEGTTGGVSANHCGTGQGGKVYQLLPTVAKREPETVLENVGETLLSLRNASLEPSATTSFEATVIVKNSPQKFSVPDTTTVGELIATIASKYNEQMSDPVRHIEESQIKLLFSGRFLQNDQVVSQIPGYEKGVSTILSVIRNTNGGTAKKRRHKKNKKTLRTGGRQRTNPTLKRGRRKKKKTKAYR